MEDKELLEAIDERIPMLEAVMVSGSDVVVRNKIEGKLKALKLIKKEKSILGMSTCELTTLIDERFNKNELGIKGKYIREGFEEILKEYTGYCTLK